MGVRWTGDWQRALGFSNRAKAAIKKVLEDEADELADQMRKGLASGSPAGTVLAPLHPLTAALKGSSVPLAGMERWVTTVKTGPMTIFIGFRDPWAVYIGTIHEEGRTWTQVWTDRQRRWFFAMMSKFGLLDPTKPSTGASTGEHTVTIPARPWVAPIVAAYLPGARKRITDAVVRAILK